MNETSAKRLTLLLRAIGSASLTSWFFVAVATLALGGDQTVDPAQQGRGQAVLAEELSECAVTGEDAGFNGIVVRTHSGVRVAGKETTLQCLPEF